MLFLVHHADAVDPRLDPQRPLSQAGRVHADHLAVRVHDRGVKPDVIWHSGKLRARQTAEPLWRVCNPLAEFSATRGLQPDDPPEWIKDVVEGDARDIMLVGHMPHMARLYRLLVFQLSTEPAADFPQHGCVALVKADRGWTEVWKEV